MTSSLRLTLDTAPPASPVLSVNSGALRTGDRVVLVDAATPSPDAAELLLWGDVDPTADSRVQPAEGAASWQPWGQVAVRLSAGSGVKRLHARLRDDVANATPAFTASIELDLDTPVVSVASPPDRTRLSRVSPHDRSTFSWRSSRDYVAYQVRAVPSPASTHLDGVPVGSAHGSTSVGGAGVFLAATPVTTVLTAADLQAAHPGDGRKIVKAFVRDAQGRWSA